VKRYIIHLLPEPERRAKLDELRHQIAEQIGWNKALDYPTTHLTLVQGIQDGENVTESIDSTLLVGLLDRLANTGPIHLTPSPSGIYGRDVLMKIADSTQLAITRRAAFEATRRIVAMPDGENAKSALAVKEQSWPHLTFVQDVDAPRAQQALAFLTEHGQWVTQPLVATEIALIGRDLASGEPYRIVHRVSLQGHLFQLEGIHT
jgi:hypothetical protein